MEKAEENRRPLVLIFAAPHIPDAGIFYNEEIAEMSRTIATFVRINDDGSRPRGDGIGNSTVPGSKLDSDHLPREFRVQANRITVVICDWWGNEWNRTNEKVSPSALRRMIGQVESRVESEESRLQSMLNRAREAMDIRKDERAALTELLRMFRTEKYGFTAMKNAASMYHDICDRARARISELVADTDLAGLRALGTQFRDTDLYPEIEQAIAMLTGRLANAR